ncbi:MAG: alpha/beta fold hydrolase [Chloroflexota bacterium]
MRTGNVITIGAGVAGVAGMELFNRSVVLERDDLEARLPVEPSMWEWQGHRIALYRNGDPEKPPMLLLHGHHAAASALEMSEPFSSFAENYSVLAPDLLGYGLSDRPDIEYSPALYIELITDLLRDVIGRPAVVMALSLSSAYAIEVAAANPELVDRLVLICPTGVGSLQKQSAGGKALQTILKSPLLGQALYNALSSHKSIEYYLSKQSYYDESLVTPELVEEYYRTSHVPGARYAPSAFVGGALYDDVREEWARLETPTLIVWGAEAKMTPVSDAAPFLAINPSAKLEEIAASGLMPQDEQPEQFANIVGAWLDKAR